MIVLNKYKFALIILVFFISCDDTTPPTISNKVVVPREKEMYLYGWNNEKYQIKLSWYDYYGCNSYDITIPEIEYQNTTNTQADHYHYINDIDYLPGSSLMAYVNCSDNQNVEYYDSILVTTKTIAPIENIIVNVIDDGYKDSLTFTHSSDSNINGWDFYHFKFNQNYESSHPHYFDITNSESGWEKDEFPEGWWGNTGWGTNKLDYYNYSKENIDDSFCYVIKVTDDKNYSRNSHIKCSDNFTRNANNAVQIIATTNNLPRRIIVEWEQYTDPDFYQYILWRSEYENMPKDSTQQLAILTNNNQTTYEDRYYVSDGKQWYYKIEVENQYGKSEFSDIQSGGTRP